jgi:hypothetical protein
VIACCLVAHEKKLPAQPRLEDQAVGRLPYIAGE